MYSMKSIADKMVEENPHQKEEFFEWLETNPQFENYVRMRMKFFYIKSPYHDDIFNLHPGIRIEEIYN